MTTDVDVGAGQNVGAVKARRPYRRNVDLTGRKFNRWTVEGKAAGRRTHWACRCECGTTREVNFQNLLRGLTLSCGCFNREDAARRSRAATIHGMTRSPEFRIWSSMICRCHSPANSQYHKYGARGILVCDLWRHSFKDFYADMGPRPSPAHSIDRIDGTIGYRPKNCRWATPVQQNRNRRSCRVVAYRGRMVRIVDLAEGAGIDANLIAARLSKGFSVEDAVEIEAGPGLLKTRGRRSPVFPGSIS